MKDVFSDDAELCLCKLIYLTPAFWISGVARCHVEELLRNFTKKCDTFLPGSCNTIHLWGICSGSTQSSSFVQYLQKRSRQPKEKPRQAGADPSLLGVSSPLITRSRGRQDVFSKAAKAWKTRIRKASAQPLRKKATRLKQNEKLFSRWEEDNFFCRLLCDVNQGLIFRKAILSRD